MTISSRPSRPWWSRRRWPPSVPFAGVAHEINTPIGISVTASSHLQERVADFKQHIEAKQPPAPTSNEFTQNLDESMQLLQGNLRRASELIASFKQVAVDQSSEARYNFSLADNLHQVVVSPATSSKKAQCEVDIQCDPKLSIYSFPGSFTQIYSNLILNSIHHGFDGWDRPRKITIQVAQQGDELVIDYSDNGRGIPRRYCRASSIPFVTSKRGQGGSGLGTHIIYNLVVQLLRPHPLRQRTGPGRPVPHSPAHPAELSTGSCGPAALSHHAVTAFLTSGEPRNGTAF